MAKLSQQTDISFFRSFVSLAGGYWRSEEKLRVRGKTALLVALTVAQVVMPVMVNFWSERLFDALEQHSMDRLLGIALSIVGIMAFNVAVQTQHLRVKRSIQFGWREWLSHDVLEDWLSRGRHHQITYLPGDHDNPDGRIAEDIRISVEYAVELAHSLLYSAILLISFTNILWMLSGAPVFDLGGWQVAIPGYLVYIAMIYAAAGTSLATLVGRPLVRAVNQRQGFEADYRFGLVRVREYAQDTALLHAESEERRRMYDLLLGVRLGWYRQTHALIIVTLFSAAYSVLSTAVPILVSAPRYVMGVITLGTLMQTAQAFQQTVQALSWPIDNLGRAAEWKASVERVLGLRDALRQLDRETEGQPGAGGVGRITIAHRPSQRSLSFQHLAVCDPAGHRVIEPFDAEILPGQRVLIAGDPNAAIALFRAVARVWPWGEGRINLPAHTRVFFMPQRPYLPRGPLKGALTYPAPPDSATDAAVVAALARVGLGHLSARLDESSSWEDRLALAEQQRLGFARLVLRHPNWIFLEDATDALDPDGEAEMLALLDDEFAHATVLTISHRESLDQHQDRKFVLERQGEVTHLREVFSHVRRPRGHRPHLHDPQA